MDLAVQPPRELEDYLSRVDQYFFQRRPISETEEPYQSSAILLECQRD